MRKKCERNISSHSETFEGDNLDTIAEKLETKFTELMSKEFGMLNKKIEFGLMLLNAKMLFKQKKKQKWLMKHGLNGLMTTLKSARAMPIDAFS